MKEIKVDVIYVYRSGNCILMFIDRTPMLVWQILKSLCGEERPTCRQLGLSVTLRVPRFDYTSSLPKLCMGSD